MIILVTELFVYPNNPPYRESKDEASQMRTSVCNKLFIYIFVVAR